MLTGKHALVTGASRGIGKAIATDLAAAGANVSFTYRENEAKAEQLLSELRADHPERRFSACKCDVAVPSEVQSALKSLIAGNGPVDALINNAGIIRDVPFFSMKEEDWKLVLDTNLTGIFHVTKALAFDFLKRKSGTIVNITSVAGVYGNAGQANYSASKAGIIGFTKSLSKEMGPYGIRVNAVAPGFIETDMTGGIKEKDLEEYKKRISLRRMGRASEVAHAVTFLASELSSYLTGHVLMVDGGISL
ncbi:MAG TPA: beta-ketoacyl-ACP reductase [Fibrobacteria bacterium]|nr:beta-ketoacyl-ACP reductase [Fibrobacteria bacterium]